MLWGLVLHAFPRGSIFLELNEALHAQPWGTVKSTNSQMHRQWSSVPHTGVFLWISGAGGLFTNSAAASFQLPIWGSLM